MLAKKLKDKGHPVGFALGRAIGDGNQSHYPMLWAFGGAECKKDGKTVAINSPETAKSVDYRRKLYQDGETEDVLSWDDSSNNRAFLAEAVSVTGNAASIYWAEKKNAPQLRDVPDERRPEVVQGDPAQVDVVVGHTARGQRDRAVHHGQVLDEGEQLLAGRRHARQATGPPVGPVVDAWCSASAHGGPARHRGLGRLQGRARPARPPLIPAGAQKERRNLIVSGRPSGS